MQPGGEPHSGFHVQQAVEKALAAAPAHAQIVFRRTHDIAELMDLLENAGLAAPPHADHRDELDPYATEMRYGLVEPGDLDGAATGLWVRDVIASANSLVR